MISSLGASLDAELFAACPVTSKLFAEHSCTQPCRMKASLGHNVGMVGPHSVIFLVLMSNESAMLAGHLPSLLFGLPSLATPSFSLRAKVQKHKQLTRLVLWHALGALDFS